MANPKWTKKPAAPAPVEAEPQQQPNVVQCRGEDLTLVLAKLRRSGRTPGSITRLPKGAGFEVSYFQSAGEDPILEEGDTFSTFTPRHRGMEY